MTLMPSSSIWVSFLTTKMAIAKRRQPAYEWQVLGASQRS
jgi:hypothetical protein